MVRLSDSPNAKKPNSSPFTSVASTSAVRLTEGTCAMPIGSTATKPSGESITINPRSCVNWHLLQRMKTKWGSCNHRTGHIRLNTELVKKPRDLLEYVVVHEMVDLLEPTHSDCFIAMLQEHYPTWREARAELNELPLAAEVWRE